MTVLRALLFCKASVCQSNTDEHSGMGTSLAEAQKMSHTFPIVFSCRLSYLISTVYMNTHEPPSALVSSPHRLQLISHPHSALICVHFKTHISPSPYFLPSFRDLAQGHFLLLSNTYLPLPKAVGRARQYDVLEWKMSITI